MGRGISLASSFRPDFGVPYPRGWEADFEALGDGDLIALAGVKAQVDGGGAVDVRALPERIRAQATRLVVERNAREDAVSYGWTLEKWAEVLENWGNYTNFFILGGNRSSKSVMASRLVVWCLLNIPECRVRCYQVNDEKSVSEQQAYIWDALPERFKTLGRRRGQTHSVEYTQKNGFTGGKLILPPLKGCDRGGECIFGTYQQYRNDPQVVEGFWCHLIWADEEMEQKMFERLLYRVKDADGRIVNTFTTIKGWTPLVEDVIAKARTVKKRRATLLGRDLPVTQVSTKRAKTRIDYFWTEDNPFLPPATMESFRGRPEDEIKATAYGIPTRNAVAVLSLFDEDVHVIAHDKLPWAQFEAAQRKAAETGAPWAGQTPPHYTRYLIIDPAGDKPWFMVWGAVDAMKRKYIYREWPDEGFGAWGEAGATPDGVPGPAQKSNSYAIEDYVEAIRHAEGEEEIFERLIDPRLANTPMQTREGAVTIQSELEAAGMVVVAAPGNNIHHGLDLIKSALQWDRTRDISSLNAPKLFISDRCQNLIEALRNYSNYSAKEVWKDPVDCVRYWLEAGADHVPPEAMQSGNRTFSY